MPREDPDSTEQASLAGATVRGVFWITAGRFLKAPINLLSIAVLARLLTPADFGIVAIGTIAVSLSNVIVDGSFGMVLIQRRTINPGLIGASLAAAFGLALLIAATIMLSAPLIEREFDFPQLREVLLLLGGVLPVTAVTMVTTALLQRALQFRVLTVIGLLSQAIFTAVAIGLAFAGAGLWALVIGQIASFLLQAALGYLAVRRNYTLRFSLAGIRDVISSGGMFTVSRLLNLAANNSDRIIIGRFLGAASLGFYSRASSLMTTARDVSGAGPIRVLFSSFAKMQNEPERMAKAYLRALSVSLIASALCSAFVVANSEIIVRVLLGPKWLETVPIMQILFSAFIARSGYVVAEAVPLALGLSGQSALRQGAQLVLVIVGALVGSRYGVLGAVIGISMAYWTFYFLCLILVQRLLPVRWTDLLRVHANGVMVALVPMASEIFIRWLLPTPNLFVEVIPAAVFAIVALVVLLLGPPKLVSDDIVRGRAHLWERVRPHVQRLHQGA